jgi:endonuclease/exonuclease/phosphatase family metal-dependent hydrolase
MGDMNTKVGKDMRAYNVGRYNLHEVSNDNVTRLIDFAVSRNMVISSVGFPHKDIHKETWISPDGHTKNHIDHMLIDARHASDIIDVKSCRGADFDSDHYLVKIKYRPRLAIASRYTGTRNVKFNVDRIKERTVKS